MNEEYDHNDYDELFSTQEETFRGFNDQIVPTLNYQILMEVEQSLNQFMSEKIDFSPLVKMTPFEKEKILKERQQDENRRNTEKLLENQILKIRTSSLRKVIFDDELPAETRPRSLSPYEKPTQNITLIPLKEEASCMGRLETNKTSSKSILKSRTKSKYFSTQDSLSPNHSSTFSPISAGFKRPVFPKFTELINNERIESEEIKSYEDDSVIYFSSNTNINANNSANNSKKVSPEFQKSKTSKFSKSKTSIFGPS